METLIIGGLVTPRHSSCGTNSGEEFEVFKVEDNFFSSNSFILLSAIAGEENTNTNTNTNTRKLLVSIPSAPVSLQGPFDILAIVPVDSLGGDILIEGMTTQFPA